MGRAHSTFRIRPPAPGFSAGDSCSVFFCSFILPFQFLQPPGLIDLHVPKLLLPPMEGHLQPRFSCRQISGCLFHHDPPTLRMRVLVFRRIPFAFRLVSSFLASQTDTSSGSKKRSHIPAAFMPHPAMISITCVCEFEIEREACRRIGLLQKQLQGKAP